MAFGVPTSAQPPSRNQPSFLIHFGVFWGLIMAHLGPLWTPLNRPWTHFGRPWGPCGRPAVPSGRPQETQGGPTQLQGSILVDLGSHFGLFWAHVCPFRSFSGACWHHFSPSPLCPTTHVPVPRHILPTQKTPSGEHRRESIPLCPVRLKTSGERLRLEP